MLTIKHVNCGAQQVFECAQVDFETATDPKGGAPGRPAAVIAHRDIGGLWLQTEGTVYVMNDKGRTIATYNLDHENSLTVIRPINDDATPLTAESA